MAVPSLGGNRMSQQRKKNQISPPSTLITRDAILWEKSRISRQVKKIQLSAPGSLNADDTILWKRFLQRKRTAFLKGDGANGELPGKDLISTWFQEFRDEVESKTTRNKPKTTKEEKNAPNMGEMKTPDRELDDLRKQKNRRYSIEVTPKMAKTRKDAPKKAELKTPVRTKVLNKKGRRRKSGNAPVMGGSLLGLPISRMTGDRRISRDENIQKSKQIDFVKRANKLLQLFRIKNSELILKYIENNEHKLVLLEDEFEIYKSDSRLAEKIHFVFLEQTLNLVKLIKEMKPEKLEENLEYFKWPSTEIRTLVMAATPDVGAVHHAATEKFSGERILSDFDYRVGRRGLPISERRRILGSLLTTSHQRFEAKYNNFGKPGSAQRLRRLAYAIAYCVRRAKRQSNDYSIAIDDWETDLRYLKQHHYDGKFDWPQT
jgi:hypothetical protein